MTETEIKIMLSQAQYDIVGTLFNWSKEITQVNHYYHSDSAAGVGSVRARETEEGIFLQVKVPISKDGALHTSREYERKIDSVPEFVSAQALETLTGMKLTDMPYVGALKTVRRLCTEYPQTEICLDRNDYCGKTDFELEIEYTGEYPDGILEELADAGIRLGNGGYGKYGRFLAAVKNG